MFPVCSALDRTQSGRQLDQRFYCDGTGGWSCWGSQHCSQGVQGRTSAWPSWGSHPFPVCDPAVTGLVVVGRCTFWLPYLS